MSSTKHPLELLLQNHLGTDESALKYLPNIITTLQQPDIFGEARVLGKWNARISSFLHSREAASRWVGLYLARYTALGSRQILVDNAQGWVGVVLPMLSKPEPPPNHYAAIRLLSYIFTAITDMPEFQRQVVIPNVQKYSQALLALAKDPESEFDLKLLSIDSLTQLVTYHPTHHKALHQQLFNFILEHLQGSFPLPSNVSLLTDSQSPSLVTSSIQLHVVLALTGGKVGAGMLWRQSLDSTMGTIWAVLETLRSTYLDVPRPSTTMARFSFPELPADPALAGPTTLDRFRSMIRLLVDLLKTPTSRPVSIPLGQLAHLVLALLRFSATSQSQSTSVVYEAVQRANEVAIVPELCAAGCMLAQQLAQTCGKLSTPYVSQLFVAITHQLEQNITTELRTRLLKTIPPILANTHNPAPSASYNRLAAQVLRVLSPLLPSSRTYSSIRTPQESAKGKKRARYEGDELFSSNSLSGSTNLQSPANSELDTAALFALAMLRPTLPLTTQTTIHRTLLALLLYLPRTGNARRLTQEISRVYACALGEGSSGTLGIGVKALKGVEETYDLPFIPGTDHHHILQQFLHPRVPPNSKSGPAIDDILLFWKDEEEEEAKEFRQTAAILTAKNISASKLVSETFHDSNEVDHMMKGQGAEMPNLGQNDVANGVNMPEPFATASASQPSFQPIMPPVAPTELKSAAPAATPTRITSSAPPESTGAIPASSLFRTPEALNTNQASHSPALITGSFSLQPS
ncbi:rRNA processing/ribosome biogenesis protein, partial [Rhizoctonia solani 123E]